MLHTGGGKLFTALVIGQDQRTSNSLLQSFKSLVYFPINPLSPFPYKQCLEQFCSEHCSKITILFSLQHLRIPFGLVSWTIMNEETFSIFDFDFMVFNKNIYTIQNK